MFNNRQNAAFEELIKKEQTYVLCTHSGDQKRRNSIVEEDTMVYRVISNIICILSTAHGRVGPLIMDVHSL